MNGLRTPVGGIALACTVAALALCNTSWAGGKGFFKRARATAYAPTQAVVARPYQPMVGTFYDTPYMMVGGNGFTGGAGYTPLQQYGSGALALYGPMSSLRATAAPVRTVTRGYDGSIRVETGTTFSYPFLPAASPVVYPTRSQVRGGSPAQSTPPWWDTGHGWVDQN